MKNKTAGETNFFPYGKNRNILVSNGKLQNISFIYFPVPKTCSTYLNCSHTGQGAMQWCVSAAEKRSWFRCCTAPVCTQHLPLISSGSHAPPWVAGGRDYSHFTNKEQKLKGNSTSFNRKLFQLFIETYKIRLNIFF